MKNYTSEKIKYARKITMSESDPMTERFVETSSVLGTGKNAKISIACKHLFVTLLFSFPCAWESVRSGSLICSFG